jgi:hypothetical protein
LDSAAILLDRALQTELPLSHPELPEGDYRTGRQLRLEFSAAYLRRVLVPAFESAPWNNAPRIEVERPLAKDGLGAMDRSFTTDALDRPGAVSLPFVPKRSPSDITSMAHSARRSNLA